MDQHRTSPHSGPAARPRQRPERTSTRCCPTVSYYATVSACPYAEGSLRESLGVAFALVDQSEDYQGQRLLNIVAAVYVRRDGSADHVERRRHDGDSLGAV